jgi:hypothetical protein
MFADQLAVAIDGARSHERLNELSRTIWKGVAAGAVGDDDAQRLAELIHARRTAAKAIPVAAGWPSGRPSLFPFRRPQRPPVRSVAIERRRRLAYSGPLPPALASRFTLGELAVLRIVTDEVRDRGSCALTLPAIAARAGCCRELARRTLRKAEREELLTVQERRRPGQVNLSNIIRIISREWLAWINRGPRRQTSLASGGIAPTKLGPTDTRGFRKEEGRSKVPLRGEIRRSGGDGKQRLRPMR